MCAIGAILGAFAATTARQRGGRGARRRTGQRRDRAALFSWGFVVVGGIFLAVAAVMAVM